MPSLLYSIKPHGPPAYAAGDCLHFVTADSRRFPSALQGLPVKRGNKPLKEKIFFFN
jgi:hypothetical protein